VPNFLPVISVGFFFLFVAKFSLFCEICFWWKIWEKMVIFQQNFPTFQKLKKFGENSNTEEK
jgi:hypothetical protein